MNKLEQKIFDCLDSNLEGQEMDDGAWTTSIYGQDIAAKGCTTIAIDFAKGFDEWKQKVVAMKLAKNKYAVTTSSELNYKRELTIEELITEYIKTL